MVIVFMIKLSRRFKQATTATLLLLSANAMSIQITPNQPSVAAKSFILVDQATGKILASENENTLLAPAS